jgi:hypothetical protein
LFQAGLVSDLWLCFCHSVCLHLVVSQGKVLNYAATNEAARKLRYEFKVSGDCRARLILMVGQNVL